MHTRDVRSKAAGKHTNPVRRCFSCKYSRFMIHFTTVLMVQRRPPEPVLDGAVSPPSWFKRGGLCMQPRVRTRTIRAFIRYRFLSLTRFSIAGSCGKVAGRSLSRPRDLTIPVFAPACLYLPPFPPPSRLGRSGGVGAAGACPCSLFFQVPRGLHLRVRADRAAPAGQDPGKPQLHMGEERVKGRVGNSRKLCDCTQLPFSRSSSRLLRHVFFSPEAAVA